MIKQSWQSSMARQSGMVLVTSLLLLIVVTLLAVGMFRSFGLDEKIAGNVREKHRALSAAETAEQYAEYWLATVGGTPIACAAGFVSFNPGQVCTIPLANADRIPWTSGVNYIPTVGSSAMNVTGVNGGQGAYFKNPAFYIGFLGATPSGLGTIYQIDAVGYGGSVDTAAVVEATYVVQSSTKDLGAP
jgi:type IV pilus assembly protein PilX